MDFYWKDGKGVQKSSNCLRVLMFTNIDEWPDDLPMCRNREQRSLQRNMPCVGTGRFLTLDYSRKESWLCSLKKRKVPHGLLIDAEIIPTDRNQIVWHFHDMGSVSKDINQSNHCRMCRICNSHNGAWWSLPDRVSNCSAPAMRWWCLVISE